VTFKARITIGLAVLALVPLALVGLFVRREMTNRLSSAADSRVAARLAAIRGALEREATTTRSRLRVLAADLAADNRFRLGTSREGDRGWLLDWAGSAMRAGGLDLLVLQDSTGRVVSSGQFRNEYDRSLPALPNAVAAGGLGALVLARTPDSTVLALAALDSFVVAGRRYTLIGGPRFDPRALGELPGDADVTVQLVAPGGAAPAGVVDEIALRYLDTRTAGPGGNARLVATRDLGPVTALRRQVDRFFLSALGVTLALVVVVALWLGRRLAGPLAELAAKTERLELDGRSPAFAIAGEDEVGVLARGLDTMADRLTRSAARLKEAERRAAQGEIARQVNHDVKNGLVPIRNVVRHLTDVADREPARMADIFRERRGTLESSIEYLDELAKRYARLSPVPDRGPADLNHVVEAVVGSAVATGVAIDCRLTTPLPPVRADPIALRRIVENLVSNAVDAARIGKGAVTVGTSTAGAGVCLTVHDSGPGMSQDELDRAFVDFYTTKPEGTGLGLSVVRRLVADLGGALRVETEPGHGSRFIVEIPSA
jgi:signal transduction histidine kinase